MNIFKKILLSGFLILFSWVVILDSAQEEKENSTEETLSEEEIVSKKLSSNIKIEEKGNNVYNLELRNADLKDIIRFFAYRYGLNIIADKEVKGTVTASLGNITIKEALKQILDSQGYVMEEVDNVIRVKKKPPSTEVFKLKNISVIIGKEEEDSGEMKEKYITDLLEPFLSEKGKIVVDAFSNSVMVTDNEENLRMIRKFIQNIDIRTKQVLIEAKFIETTLSETEQLGINWSVVASAAGAARPHTYPFRKVGEKSFFPDVDESSTTFSSKTGFPVVDEDSYIFGTLDFTEFQAVLQALLTNSDTKVISNPRVATLNNQEAKVGITTEYPLPTYEINSDTGELTVSGYEYKEIGITLEVTPLITPDDYITMIIEPTVGSASETVTVTGTGFELPIITSKKATTKVTVKDGETIVIGGLIEGNKSKTERKIPLLGSIPLLGKLFTYKTGSDSNSELLIFVTPHILNPVGQKERESKKIAKLYQEIEGAIEKNKYEEVILKGEEILNIRPQEEKAKELIQEAHQKIEEQKEKKRIEARLEQAVKLYQEKKYQSAKKILEEILNKDIENEKAKKYLSLCSDAIQKEEKLKSLQEEAKRLYKKKDYKSAKEKYSAILILRPEDETANKMVKICEEKIRSAQEKKIASLMRKAKAALAKNKYREAESYFNKILELEPENELAQSYISKIEQQQEEVKKEKESDYLLEKAKMLFQEGKYEEAIRIFEEVLELEPQREEAKVYLRLCKERSLEFPEKGEQKPQVKKTGEKKVREKKLESLFNQGLEKYRNKKFKEAIALFEQVLIKEPSNQRAYEYLEKCYQELEKQEKEQREKQISELIQEGKSYLREGQYDKALLSFYNALEIDPKNEEAKRYLSSLKKRISVLKSREAKELTRELSRKESQWIDAELEKAEIYLMEGNINKAEEIATKILESQESRKAREILEQIAKERSSQPREVKKREEVKGRDVRKIYLEAMKLYKEGEYQKALDKFEILSNLSSRYQKKSQTMAGKCAEKLEILQRKKIIEKKYQLALHYFDMALYEKCIGLLMEVIDLKPGYKDAQSYLKLAQKRLKMLEELGEFEQTEIEAKDEI